MKVATTIAAISLLFTSALEALKISSPTAGSTFSAGSAITVLVENEASENFINALVTFASPCGSWVQTVPVGSAETIYVPCNVVGQTTVAAQSGNTKATSVQILISQAYNNCNPYPCADPLLNGCGYENACGPIACPPRPSCRRRSRRGCGYYAEAADSIQEFNAQDSELEQQKQN